MKSVQTYGRDAAVLFNKLNSVFVIFKPASTHFMEVRFTLIHNLCKDLNSKPVREPIKHITIEGVTNEPMKVNVHSSYADHPLVVGPRYQLQDFRMVPLNHLATDSCGVQVMGVNKGSTLINWMKNSKCTKFYQLKGLLGQATNNYFHTGKIIEKSTYAHVKRGHLDKLCSSMQSSHQRKMFELCGVDIQSQAAYELAVKGLLRPADSKIPMLYTIKCIDFSPPEFILEVVCINETELYLKSLIHHLGLKLRSCAVCTKVLCTQVGLFDTNHALLSKNWTLNNILRSMDTCDKILKENKFLLKQDSPVLIEHEID